MDKHIARHLIARLNGDAELIAARFGLRYRCIEAERSNVKSRYGICYDDGSIRIRLVHAVSGRPLKYSSLVDTLCHELAHLRHFHHGPQFKAFYERILTWARREQIYRPGPDPLDPGRLAERALRESSGTSGVPGRRAGGRRRPSGPVQPELGLAGISRQTSSGAAPTAAPPTPARPGSRAPEQLSLFSS